MLKNFLFLLFSIIVLTSCEDENKVEQEISKIPVEVKVDRFDQVFAKLLAKINQDVYQQTVLQFAILYIAPIAVDFHYLIAI